MTGPTARKVWFALFVVVVFCLGAAAGVVADRQRVPGRGPLGIGGPGRFMRDGPPKPAEIADRMSRELNLTAEQRQQLEQVLEQNGERLVQFRRETGVRFQALRQQLDADIARILTPEQRERFEQQRRRRERNRPRRRE